MGGMVGLTHRSVVSRKADRGLRSNEDSTELPNSSLTRKDNRR